MVKKGSTKMCLLPKGWELTTFQFDIQIIDKTLFLKIKQLAKNWQFTIAGFTIIY